MSFYTNKDLGQDFKKYFDKTTSTSNEDSSKKIEVTVVEIPQEKSEVVEDE